MKLIPTSCCFIIWTFIGKNATYLNKELLTLLNKKRKDFINNPITLYYRLAQLKEIHYYNQYESERHIKNPRPSMVVEKKVRMIKLNGNLPFGILKIENKILPSKKLYDEIIPCSEREELGGSRYWYQRYKIQYWEIFHLFCNINDIERVKLYQYLFPCNDIHKISILNVF